MLIQFSSRNKSKINNVVKHFFNDSEGEDFSKLRSILMDIIIDSFSQEELITLLSVKSLVLRTLNKGGRNV